jgi:hypothetical protein
MLASTVASVLRAPVRVLGQRADVAAAVRGLVETAAPVSIDVEALCTSRTTKHFGNVSLVQLCTATPAPAVYLVDVLAMGPGMAGDELRPLVENEAVTKYIFDCRRDVEALSTQLGLRPRGLLDIQLYYAAVQWKLRGSTKRNGVDTVFRAVVGDYEAEGGVADGEAKRDGDHSEVVAAMEKGDSAVWDVRPLPPSFIEYAADDVRRVLLAANALLEKHPERLRSADRLTQMYVSHYAQAKLVTHDIDPAPLQVNREWLEMLTGTGGTCSRCGQRGHTEDRCTQRALNKKLPPCSVCGEVGHLPTACRKATPIVHICERCGCQGHPTRRCPLLTMCIKCGGLHLADAPCTRVVNPTPSS